MLELNTVDMVLITANQMRLYTRKLPLTSSMKSIHPHYLATAEFPMREFTHYKNRTIRSFLILFSVLESSEVALEHIFRFL